MAVHATGARSGRRVAILFLIAVTGYFAAQIALRIALGGALETDEAEMMVMTPGLQLGYGPQLPLYNWIQIGLFELFGRTLFALSLMKNGLLWLTYLLVFLGLRLWVPASAAAFAALALYLVPDISWEAQRATTHSNILLATSAATLAAFLWAVRRGSWASFVALGVAVGLGGLSKYNFWMVPAGLIAAGLTVAPMRRRLLSLRALIAPAIAALLVAAPYAWMLRHPDLAFSSVGKLHLDEAADSGRLAEALLLTGQSALALLAVPAIAAFLLWLLGRRPKQPEAQTGEVAALLLRAALLLCLAVIAGVWLAQVGYLTQRWLLPIAFLLVPAMFLWLHGRLAVRGQRLFHVFLALLAAAIIAGLIYDRFKPGARRDVDFSTLPEALAAVAPMPQTPIVAEFYTAGNIARLQPDWRVAPYLAFAAREFGGAPVLFVIREDIPSRFGAGLRAAGWNSGEAGVEILAQGALALPYMSSEGAMPFRYVLARTPARE